MLDGQVQIHNVVDLANALGDDLVNSVVVGSVLGPDTVRAK